MKRYNPKDIEPRWQKIWEEQKLYQANESTDRPKYYALEYFPYPSGVTMHVGHVRNYVISDTDARHKRMQGYNVLHPMGWDAFGLPAENYAIKNGVSPRKSTDDNIAIFKRQLTQVGLSYDWSREIDSSQPEYYRWTQWLFLKFYEKGLAYKAEAPVNWCPKDKTVLANEQVIKADGRNVCERCETEVEKRQLSQWMLKITDYADRLLADLDDLDWPESIKTMQRNWIGRSKGAEITFKVTSQDNLEIKVFTTRPDTLYGATFMVLAPEHPMVQNITAGNQKESVEQYVKQAQAKSDVERQETEREKTGVFTGAYAINPVNQEKLPIWIADYVLMGYGTGAIMAVPAHDDRDHEFATKFNLPIVEVIEPVYGEKQGDESEKQAIIAVVKHWSEDKYLVLDWGPRMDRWGGKLFVGGGLDSGDENYIEAAKREITEETGYANAALISEMPEQIHTYYFSNVKNQNYYAKCKGLFFQLKDDVRENQKLDDGEIQKFKIEWVEASKLPAYIEDAGHALVYQRLVSKLSYRGEGIMVNSDTYSGKRSETVREQIVADLSSQGVGREMVNYKIRDWLISRQRYWGAPIPIIYCEKCGTSPVPENQLPVELPPLESYEPSDDGRSPLARVPEFINVSCPRCGGNAERETDTMDTFIDSSWYFLRFTDPQNNQAPFDSAKANYWMQVDSYVGGAEHAVAHLLFARFWMKFLYDQGMVTHSEPFRRLRNQGMIGGADGRKMGKRYGNVVTPDELIEQGYGADALRLFELFIAPFDQGSPWNTTGVPGTYRFLQRVWTLCQEYLTSIEATQTASSELAQTGNDELRRTIHKAIKKVSQDLEVFSLNTAVATMMETVNDMYKIKAKYGYTQKEAWGEALNHLVQLLAPFAPHITEELWQLLGNEGSVHISAWPVHDEQYLVTNTLTIVVQVNGKVRANIEVPTDASEESVISMARTDRKVTSFIQDKTPRKTIYVSGKLVNFVV